MADEEMDGDKAGTDDGTCEGANGSADDCPGDRACAYATAVFDAVAFEVGTGSDCAFIADTGSGARGSGDLSIESVAGAVGKDDGVGIETHGAVTTE